MARSALIFVVVVGWEILPTASIDFATRAKRSVFHNQKLRERFVMLGWSITFLIVALLAGLLGFWGIAGTAAYIAKVLFVIFVVLFLVSLIVGRRVT